MEFRKVLERVVNLGALAALALVVLVWRVLRARGLGR